MRSCFLWVILLPKQLGFLASSIMKDIVKSNLQLNVQRKNEYYVNAKRQVLFLFGPPKGHEAPVFWHIGIVFILPFSLAYNREDKTASDRGF